MSDRQDEQLIGKILFKHYKLKKKIGQDHSEEYILVLIQIQKENMR